MIPFIVTYPQPLFVAATQDDKCAHQGGARAELLEVFFFSTLPHSHQTALIFHLE